MEVIRAISPIVVIIVVGVLIAILLGCASTIATPTIPQPSMEAEKLEQGHLIVNVEIIGYHNGAHSMVLDELIR